MKAFALVDSTGPLENATFERRNFISTGGKRQSLHTIQIFAESWRSFYLVQKSMAENRAKSRIAGGEFEHWDSVRNCYFDDFWSWSTVFYRYAWHWYLLQSVLDEILVNWKKLKQFFFFLNNLPNCLLILFLFWMFQIVSRKIPINSIGKWFPNLKLHEYNDRVFIIPLKGAFDWKSEKFWEKLNKFCLQIKFSALLQLVNKRCAKSKDSLFVITPLDPNGERSANRSKNVRCIRWFWIKESAKIYWMTFANLSTAPNGTLSAESRTAAAIFCMGRRDPEKAVLCK